MKQRHHRKVHLSRVDSLIIEQSSFLMQLFYEYYMKIDNLNMAKLAAFWSLKDALRSKRRVGIIAKCFSNVIQICIISDDLNVNLDVKAINEIFQSISDDNLNAESLNYIVNLYAKVMQFK